MAGGCAPEWIQLICHGSFTEAPAMLFSCSVTRACKQWFEFHVTIYAGILMLASVLLIDLEVKLRKRPTRWSPQSRLQQNEWLSLNA